MNVVGLAPSSKVSAGAASGSLITLLVFMAKYFGVEIPAEVASAAVVLFSFGASYLKVEKAKFVKA
jgi:hypothetical protein